MNPTWRVFTITGALAAGCTLPGVFRLDMEDQHTILAFFQAHLREPLFIGLLTTAAFMFSLKTFIIVTMKENVYDTKAYRDRLTDLKKLDPSLRQYGPLEDFSMLLFLSVFVSLASAVTQFTIGLLDCPWAAALSLCTAIWALEMIFVALIYMQKNLHWWFKSLDDSSK